jgi:hypothetical protein
LKSEHVGVNGASPKEELPRALTPQALTRDGDFFWFSGFTRGNICFKEKCSSNSVLDTSVHFYHLVDIFITKTSKNIEDVEDQKCSEVYRSNYPNRLRGNHSAFFLPDKLI